MRSFHESWVAALEQALPGLLLLDRELDVGARRRADLVGVEPGGRLVLVLQVEGEGDGPILDALDALAWSARHGPALAAHFECEHLDPDAPPHIVLLSEHFSDHLLARMAGLSRESVRCYEVCSVASKRGERLYLVPVDVPSRPPLPEDPTGTRVLLRALGPSAIGLAEDLLRRLDRVDPELERSPSGSGVLWSFEGAPLCNVRARRGGLEGSVGAAETFQALRSLLEVDGFLEEVLVEFRGRLRGDGPRGEGPGPDPGEPADSEDGPRGGALDSMGPLLTAEEIAAFQEP